MSSLLKKFTSEGSTIRREEDPSTFQRPRDFVPSGPILNRPADPNRTNLCSDVEVKGTIAFKDFLRLDGKFEGELRSAGTLVIGDNGAVKADIQVGNLILEGKLEGNVVAQDKIELRSSAQLFGDIKASRLIIHEGVVFVGKSDVNPTEKIERLDTAQTQSAETGPAIVESGPTLRDGLY